MEQYVGYLSEYVVASLIIFIIISIIIIFLFSRGKTGAFLSGMVRIIASLFYSPFIYLKNSFHLLAFYGEKGEKEYSKTEQYLLNKLLITLRALLILITVITLSVGIVKAWNSFLPPKGLRDRISQNEDRLDEMESQFDDLSDKVENLDDVWKDKKDNLIINYKKERQTKINDNNKENSNIENRLKEGKQFYGQFKTVKNYLYEHKNYTVVYKFDDPKNNAERYVDRIELPANINKEMKNYITNWYDIMIATLELNNFTEELLRNQIQPNYSDLTIRKNRVQERIKDLTKYINRLDEQAEYSFGSLIKEILLTILTIIIFIWLVGIVLELLALSVNLATNVEKINSLLLNKNSKIIDNKVDTSKEN